MITDQVPAIELSVGRFNYQSYEAECRMIAAKGGDLRFDISVTGEGLERKLRLSRSSDSTLPNNMVIPTFGPGAILHDGPGAAPRFQEEFSASAKIATIGGFEILVEIIGPRASTLPASVIRWNAGTPSKYAVGFCDIRQVKPK